MTQRTTRTKTRIEAELKENLAGIPAGSGVFLAVSGGVDSVLLARLVAHLKGRGDLPEIKTIFIVHVDHALRGKESREDFLFVKELASELGFRFLGHKIRWKKGEKKNQDTCRKRRHAFFAKCLQGMEGFLVLAHHEDDQAETVLQRLLRGTGVAGLGAMRTREGKVLRPLLGVSRKEIEEVARGMNLAWREDRTNRESKYERNWIRNEVMPLLEKRRPGVAGRLAALAREVQDLAVKDVPNSGEALLPLSDAKRLTRKELHARFGLDRQHTERLFQFLQAGKSSRLSLPGGEAWISSGWFRVGPAEAGGRIAGKGQYSSALGSWQISGSELFDRKEGSSAAVKKALVKARVPAFLRDSVPLAKAGGKLVALVPERWDREGGFSKNGVSWKYSPSALAKRIFPQGNSGRTEL